MPTEIDEVERRIQQLEIELQALKKETDDASVARREAIERELADLQRALRRDEGAAGSPKRTRSRAIRDAKERLEQAHREAERAERDADLQRAAELRYGEIPQLEAQLGTQRSGSPSCSDVAGRCSTRRSTTRRWPRSSPSGPASRVSA